MRQNDVTFIAAVIIVVVFAIFSLGRDYFTYDIVTIEVDSKERIQDGKDSYYLIYGEEEIFKNEDSFARFKFNSSDVYRDLKPGEAYRVGVVGFRVPFMSWYRNIIDIKE